MIEQGDVVVFASSDEFLKMTSQNISACDQYELPDCKLFVRAFYVEHFDVTTIDCDDVFVFKGKHYCGTFPNMVLAKDSSFVAVQESKMLRTISVDNSEKENFKITVGKKYKILNVLFDMIQWHQKRHLISNLQLSWLMICVKGYVKQKMLSMNWKKNLIVM
jgi:hypothetical protein